MTHIFFLSELRKEIQIDEITLLEMSSLFVLRLVISTISIYEFTYHLVKRRD